MTDDVLAGGAANGGAADGAAADAAAVRSLVDAFFSAFVSGPDGTERMERLRGLFVPQAVVVRTCGLEPVVMTVEEFIAPRETLLTGGSLTGFREWAVGGRIDVFGDIAHWFGGYAKSGTHDGVDVTGRGMKSIQLIRTAEGWRITAAAWDDERDGLRWPADAPPSR